ncbi:atypical/ABC1/ABC1-B protein kinase [Salpingoeca rosetta]|uniref:Atypical/ABC1/ABC1-B protein kinase n=1 Tax=Salpingoeca rosetta (strain ATCC 50818 / BSB-021) TaxID=946362 RepID=F2TVK4_SALR5|nr:atypical/ABC1/ABC1-B protein kinase [Salpingoeca rosetta]EGD72100.1 atypical/ABC1/ABC1-B protein kinase [Salpingoeca rosetta]|eukprot:XP_004998672.1 atypical/ABC1/ABC1-B protein kinase [Salpingoeca rosetta]
MMNAGRRIHERAKAVASLVPKSISTLNIAGGRRGLTTAATRISATAAAATTTTTSTTGAIRTLMARAGGSTSWLMSLAAIARGGGGGGGQPQQRLMRWLQTSAGRAARTPATALVAENTTMVPRAGGRRTRGFMLLHHLQTQQNRHLQGARRCHFSAVRRAFSQQATPAETTARTRLFPFTLHIPRAGLRVLAGVAAMGLVTFAMLYPFAWGNSWVDAPRVFYTALKRNLADFYCVLRMVYHYRKELGSLPEDMDPKERARLTHECHLKCARLLRDLFCNNAGIYIKLGQHLAVLDYVIPKEYVDTMQIMFDKAPTSDLNEVFAVIEADLGKPAEELFQHFDTTPIASASLAQVHRAVTHDGQKVAVKVQHMGLREESRGDVATVRLLVDIVRFFFPDYDYTWLIEEVQRNLPLEMDFEHEGANADACRHMFEHRADVDVPEIRWDLSSKRVLTMEFAEGCSLSDVDGLRDSGLNLTTVSRIVTELFSEQIFIHGLVHCDPHPGNLLVRRDARGAPVVVLLDHGLYRQLDEDFRDLYCRLWRALIRGDAEDIKMYAERMNAGEFYFIFAAMLTYKGWDEVIGGTAAARLELRGTEDEKEVARSSVAKYFREINALLARIPRDVLLLLKTNDCLHGLENKLRQADAHIMPGLTHATMARYCLQGIRILPTYHNFLSVRRDMLLLELKLFAMWLAFQVHEATGYNPMHSILRALAAASGSGGRAGGVDVVVDVDAVAGDGSEHQVKSATEATSDDDGADDGGGCDKSRSRQTRAQVAADEVEAAAAVASQ